MTTTAWFLVERQQLTASRFSEPVGFIDAVEAENAGVALVEACERNAVKPNEALAIYLVNPKCYYKAVQVRERRDRQIKEFEDLLAQMGLLF